MHAQAILLAIRFPSMSLRVVVLGSAQDGGLPQMCATHPNDVAASKEVGRRRAGAGLAVVQGERCLLLDASPDLRTQYWDSLMPTYDGEGSGYTMEGVVLTHAHMGHYLGLAHFGKESANAKRLPCYCTRSMGKFLASNAPWKQLVDLANLEIRQVCPSPPNAVAAAALREEEAARRVKVATCGRDDAVKAADAKDARDGQEEILTDTFSPWEGLTVRVFLVPHRAEYTDTIGISINDHLLYIPDLDAWSDWEGSALREVRRHAVSLIDATFYSKQEVENLRRSFKAIAHPPVERSIELLQDRVGDGGSSRVIFTHLNHSNPLSFSSSPEYAHVTSLGFEVAEDGMVIDMP